MPGRWQPWRTRSAILRPTAAKSRSDHDLSELQLVRDALVGDRKSIGNRGKHLRHPVAKRLNEQRLAQIERQLKRVEAEIQKLIEAREDLKLFHRGDHPDGYSPAEVSNDRAGYGATVESVR